MLAGASQYLVGAIAEYMTVRVTGRRIQTAMPPDMSASTKNY
jgi:hypothetical protein